MGPGCLPPCLCLPRAGLPQRPLVQRMNVGAHGTWPDSESLSATFRVMWFSS